MSFEIFIHIANVMFLVSYLLKDIFLLRFVNLFAGFSLLIFFVFGEGGPQSASIMWNIVFSAVNIVQLFRLYHERKPVILSTSEKEIYNNSFKDFSAKQFLTLLSAAKKLTLEKGACLLNSLQTTDAIFLPLKSDIVDEKANVCASEQSFIGAVNYITKTQPSKSLFLAESTDILRWDRGELESLLNKDAVLKSIWQTKMSGLLAQQINKQSNFQ